MTAEQPENLLLLKQAYERKRALRQSRTLRTVHSLSVLQWLSRAMGLYRESVIAKLLGVGSEASLFIFSEKIPRFLHGIFFDGLCLQLAFPNLSKHRRRLKRGQEVELEANFAGILSLVFLSAFFLAWIGAPLLVALLGPGWFWNFWTQQSEANLFGEAVVLVRRLLPGFLFITWACYLGLGLNIRSAYLGTALIPYGVNLTMMTFASMKGLSRSPVDRLVLGFNLACFGAAFLQALQAWYRGVRFFPWSFSRKRSGIRRLLRWMPIVLLGATTTQAASLLPIFVATFFSSNAMGQLHYAWRVAEFLLGSSRAGILTVLPPMLAERFKEDQTQASASGEQLRYPTFKAWLRWGILYLAFLYFPLTLWGIASAELFTQAIYGQSAISEGDLSSIQGLLKFYLLTWFAQSFAKVLALAAYATHNIKAPMWAILSASVVQFALSLWAASFNCMWMVGLASTVASLWELLALLRYLARKDLNVPWRELKRPLGLIAFSSFLACLSLKLVKIGFKGRPLWIGRSRFGVILLELVWIFSNYNLILRAMGLKKADILKPPIVGDGDVSFSRKDPVIS